MKFRTSAIALPALLATTLAADRARADLDDCTPDFWHIESGCPSSKRISQSDATCLAGEISKTKTTKGVRNDISIANSRSDHGAIMIHMAGARSGGYLGCVGSETGT